MTLQVHTACLMVTNLAGYCVALLPSTPKSPGTDATALVLVRARFSTARALRVGEAGVATYCHEQDLAGDAAGSWKASLLPRVVGPAHSKLDLGSPR